MISRMHRKLAVVVVRRFTIFIYGFLMFSDVHVAMFRVHCTRSAFAKLMHVRRTRMRTFRFYGVSLIRPEKNLSIRNLFFLFFFLQFRFLIPYRRGVFVESFRD